MTRISKWCDACNKLSDELQHPYQDFQTLRVQKKNEKKKINLRQLQREE